MVQRMEGFDAQGLKALAIAIAVTPGSIACLLSADAPPLVVIARSADVAVDSASMLRGLIERFGGKGGGRPELAQGGGLTAAPDASSPPHASCLEGRNGLRSTVCGLCYGRQVGSWKLGVGS